MMDNKKIDPTIPSYQPFRDKKGRLGSFWKALAFCMIILFISYIGWRLAGYLMSPDSAIVEVGEDDMEEYGPYPEETDKDESRIVQGKVRMGDTLYDSLRGKGISDLLLIKLERSLNGIFDFKNCRPNDQYSLRTDKKGGLIRFEYTASPLDLYVVEKVGGEYKARKEDVEFDRVLERAGGTVQSSLYEDFIDAGAEPQLVMNFARIFAWDFDFSTYTREGDKFSLIFEKLLVDGEFYQYGRILIARYENMGNEYTAVYFEDPSGGEGYYDLNGRSLKKSFLKSPLKYSRISSGYTSARFHPIYERFLPHRAIDYAAPKGTPVRAVANGKVVCAGRKGKAGIAVEIKHPNGFYTKYYHLSRVAGGIKKGVRVSQGQVICYVGSTGVSTGPHLHYELLRYNKHLNPLQFKFPPGKPVPVKFMDKFNKRRDWLLIIMDQWEDYKRLGEFTEKELLGLDSNEK